jgi:hypothetical protein
MTFWGEFSSVVFVAYVVLCFACEKIASGNGR